MAETSIAKIGKVEPGVAEIGFAKVGSFEISSDESGSKKVGFAKTPSRIVCKEEALQSGAFEGILQA